MSQAMDLAKKNLGLNNPGAETSRVSNKGEETLDEFLASLDKQEMTEAKRTRVKLFIEEMNARIQELRDKYAGKAQPRDIPGADPRLDASLAVRREIAANALMLSKEGLPLDAVSKYLQSSLNSLGGAVGTAGPIGAGDIAGLITAISTALKPSGSAGDPEIKALLKQLADNAIAQKDKTLTDLMQQNKAILDEIKVIKTGGGDDRTSRKGKVKVIKPDFSVEEFEEGEAIILQQPAPGAGGEPIEVVQERNRHDEKMLEIKAESEHKKELRELASTIPERIGRGVAKQVRESGMESFICTNCGSTIYVPPETGNIITCGNDKCRMKFERPKDEQPTEKARGNLP